MGEYLKTLGIGFLYLGGVVVVVMVILGLSWIITTPGWWQWATVGFLVPVLAYTFGRLHLRATR